MSTTPRTNRILAAALATGLLLAACGDDDGEAVREIGVEDGASASGSGSGSGSASGVASGSGSSSGSGVTSDGVTEGDGGYDYVSDVSSHRLVTEDVCALKDALDADPVDFDGAADAYREGGASVGGDGSVRTLAGFATAEDRLHPYEAGSIDGFVTEALEGSGRFAGESDAVRAQGVEKGVQNHVLVAWTIHELNTALDKAEAGELDPAEGAPHNWDEAWAFYHGAEPGCAPYATANSRAGNFGTLGDDGETALANEAILAAVVAGRDALLDGDVDAARAAADEVVRNVVITYGQATIRYATLAAADVEAGDDDVAREHQAEGLAFFRIIEPIVAEAGADVDAVLAVLDLDAEPAAGGDGDDVREALAPAFAELGITDADIGELQEG